MNTGIENLAIAMWSISNYDADALFGKMDIAIMAEAIRNISEYAADDVRNIGAIWTDCIEIAASQVGVDDTGALNIQFNYADSHVFIDREFVADTGEEDFERMGNLFYALTGYEFEVADC